VAAAVFSDPLRSNFSASISAIHAAVPRIETSASAFCAQTVEVHGSCPLINSEDSMFDGAQCLLRADAPLEKPGNVYTKALNEGAILKVVAQPIMKDGKLHRLFYHKCKDRTEEKSELVRIAP
jgi:hypothetical protein